jgi:hypothetical protein
VQQLSTFRIEMMRLLCGFAEQFSVTDLHRNATSFRSHRFLRTTSKIQQEAECSPIHYCRCGELAVQDGSTGNFVGLAPDGLSRQITVCKLTGVI